MNDNPTNPEIDKTTNYEQLGDYLIAHLAMVFRK